MDRNISLMSFYTQKPVKFFYFIRQKICWPFLESSTTNNAISAIFQADFHHITLFHIPVTVLFLRHSSLHKQFFHHCIFCASLRVKKSPDGVHTPLCVKWPIMYVLCAIVTLQTSSWLASTHFFFRTTPLINPASQTMAVPDHTS